MGDCELVTSGTKQLDPIASGNAKRVRKMIEKYQVFSVIPIGAYTESRKLLLFSKTVSV